MRKLLLLAVLLTGCEALRTNPLTDGPGVIAPDPVVGARTIMVTQRAPESEGLSDVYITLRALRDDVEVNLVVLEPDASGDATALAYLNDSRCAEVDNSNLAACAIGSLQPGEAAAPVAVHLAAGVVLQCASTASFGGIPAPCRDASR